MPEVRFVRRVSMRNSVHLMTASAKEVIAAAILDDARAMGALAGGLPIERRLATAILAALDAAGYVVVPREPTEDTPAERCMPDFWRVGQKIRYVNTNEWAWEKGDIAYVVKLRDEYRGRPAKEYQVFYTGDNDPDQPGIYWTTPDDVELIEDAAP